MTKTPVTILIVLFLIVLVGVVIYSLKPSLVNDYNLNDTDESAKTTSDTEFGATPTNDPDKIDASTNPTVSEGEDDQTPPDQIIITPPNVSIDPGNLNLGTKKWVWVKATLVDGKTLIPKRPGSFVITFNKDKTFSATTDCNGVGGEYQSQGNALTFTQMMSTKMYCEDSNEADFTQILQGTASYSFNSKGELELKQKTGGVATFK